MFNHGSLNVGSAGGAGAPQVLDRRCFYINGEWRPAQEAATIVVTNPANEGAYAVVSAGSPADIDAAVKAARTAFDDWSRLALNERVAFIRRIATFYEERIDEMGAAISNEMGAPISIARNSQAGSGLYHLKAFLTALDDFKFEHLLRPGLDNQQIVHEPIGVCGLITPWNWPMNQLALKVIPALLTGCTVVLKPSEIAPISSMLFAEFVDAAGIPKGVFNLVNGTGATAGAALSGHPDVDMITFTGSTRAGTAISRAAAGNIKRVSLELGGKSPMLVFADAPLEETVRRCVAQCFDNTGQSCNAPTRMLVERPVYEQAVSIAKKAALAAKVGASDVEGDHLGPVASFAQFRKIQEMIHVGIEEGARLVAGGPGRPPGFSSGNYVNPTVFADVDNKMRLAQEEIFGPVLCIIPFCTEEEAVLIANDSPFGLAGYVETADAERAKRVARRLRTGMVQINGTAKAPASPFGGYKQSGNGREGGTWGLEDFLEVKLISG
ncbi:aldehyde dehydrogenase family protein [Pararhizobium sp. DWP3-4]|uniref:aldehyde dehydrogenase family protein n=1 Tax=unclassified Pararhizobium TaxID=2643050 RepID=UPI003CE7541F